MSGWARGDILLFAEIEPQFAARVIERFQLRQYSAAAIWTHAALYVGDGLLIESVARAPTMVIQRGVDAHVPESAIVRMHDPRLTVEDRDALVDEANALLKRPYSFPRAAAIGASILTRRRPRSRPAQFARNTVVRGCVCSDVIEMAYNDALGMSAAPDTRGLVPPAAFYENSALQRCAVTWCRLPTTP